MIRPTFCVMIDSEEDGGLGEHAVAADLAGAHHVLVKIGDKTQPAEVLVAEPARSLPIMFYSSETWREGRRRRMIRQEESARRLATAIAHGVPIVTQDSDCDAIPYLEVIRI